MVPLHFFLFSVRPILVQLILFLVFGLTQRNYNIKPRGGFVETFWDQFLNEICNMLR
ncbi:hypothetical protein O3G_MSEX013958 [Manduca sexta]|uniref:Uncharacterized protein n=1 Tax=Manduca sexta TaxID=7130 RepID=A0A921ZSI5_MANSE|nr:hypothetical protein O3G_MSEX013958 [Manduca sexta]